MQFLLTCEFIKGKAPVPSTLSSLPSRWGKLYPPRPLVRHLLERNSIWMSSGGVQFPPSALPLAPPAAFSSIAACSQLSCFGFILPSSPALCQALPQVEPPPPAKDTSRQNLYTGISLLDLELRIQSHSPGICLYMQIPTPKLLNLITSSVRSQRF